MAIEIKNIVDVKGGKRKEWMENGVESYVRELLKRCKCSASYFWWQLHVLYNCSKHLNM